MEPCWHTGHARRFARARDAGARSPSQGSNTALVGPVGIALDAAGHLYVANLGNNSVTVYAAGASGNATPMATITGTITELNVPVGIAVDEAGHLYVANSDGNSITFYEAGLGGPTIMIVGGNTGLTARGGLPSSEPAHTYRREILSLSRARHVS